MRLEQRSRISHKRSEFTRAETKGLKPPRDPAHNLAVLSKLELQGTSHLVAAPQCRNEAHDSSERQDSIISKILASSQQPDYHTAQPSWCCLQCRTGTGPVS